MFGKGSGDSAAADLAWEEQQAEPRADAAQTMYPLALATGQRPKPAARDVADGVEAWELNFKEDWATMQVRLEEQLRLNPLNHEQKPFSEKTNVSVVDGKNLDGDPCTMVWLPAHEPGTGAGVEKKQNSDHLMACLRKWYLDLPNIVLMVQGGAAHPYSLIQGKQLASDNPEEQLPVAVVVLGVAGALVCCCCWLVCYGCGGAASSHKRKRTRNSRHSA